jgi:hypothetical protein
MVSGVFENKTCKNTLTLFFPNYFLSDYNDLGLPRFVLIKFDFQKFNEIYRRFQFWLKLDHNNDILYEGLHTFITPIRK